MKNIKKFISVLCIALVFLTGCAEEGGNIIQQKLLTSGLVDDEPMPIQYVIETKDGNSYSVNKEVFDGYKVGDEYNFIRSRGDERFEGYGE